MQPFFAVPVFNWHAGRLSTIYVRRYIESARRFPEVPPLTARQVEALDMFDSLLEDRDLNLFMDFEPGDIQLLHNHQILHDRTGYVDWPEPARKRHLLRLWLCPPDGRPLPECFAPRYGSVEIGRRGGILVPGTAPPLRLPSAVGRPRRRSRRSETERLAQIGLDAEAVVEAVGEVGHADDQGQLDDLVFGEVPLELAHRHVAQAGARRARHPLGVEQYGLLLLVEERAPLVEGQRPDLLGGDACPLRRQRCGRGLSTRSRSGSEVLRYASSLYSASTVPSLITAA